MKVCDSTITASNEIPVSVPFAVPVRVNGYIGIAGKDEVGKSLFALLLADELGIAHSEIGEISDVLIEWEAQRIRDCNPECEFSDLIEFMWKNKTHPNHRNRLRAMGNLQRSICPGAAIDRLIDAGKRIICGLREECEMDYLRSYLRGENWIIQISCEPVALAHWRPVRLLQYQNTSIDDLKKHAMDAAWLIRHS